MAHLERYTIVLGERGRLVLPARLRQHLDLQPGDRLIVTVDAEGGSRVVPARELARRLWGFYRDLAPGRSLADELIAERRDEVRREMAPGWTRRPVASWMPRPASRFSKENPAPR